jgi:molecular chaperone IbpA
MTDYAFNTSNLDRWFVGADKVLKQLSSAHDQFAKNIPGYPPYNIVKVDDNKYQIELAVAGFGKSDIDIELANNTLVVKGGVTSNLPTTEDNPITYLWKGISDKTFTRSFTLADTVEVKNAEYINGMLKIFLENVIPESKKPKKVDIN